MKLLIVEPEASGHRMALYVRLLVREALFRNTDVQLLTTKSALSHPSFQLVDQEAQGRLSIFLMPEVPPKPLNNLFTVLEQQISRYTSIQIGFNQIPESERPDVVYISYLDYCDKIISLLGSPFNNIPFSGMYMSVKHHLHEMGIGPQSKSDWLYKKLLLRLLRISSLKSLLVIDECFYTYTKTFNEHQYRKLRLIPEVGDVRGEESKALARKKFSLDPQNFVVLVYGNLTLRKGIKELLDAVVSIEDPNIKVLLAGMQSREIQDLLKNYPNAIKLNEHNRLITSCKFHDDHQEYIAFKSADIVWLGYVDFYGSSGVLFQATSMGLPIIASSQGLIGWLTQKWEVGITLQPKDIKLTARIITSLVNEGSREKYAQKGKDLARNHTMEKFANSLYDSIFEL